MDNLNLPHWMDVMQEAEDAAFSREISKQEGYVIWNIQNDEYLFISEGSNQYVGWGTDYFAMINEEDMMAVQELVLWYSHNPTRIRIDFPNVTQKQAALFEGICFDINDIQFVPCVQYKGESAQFDFIHSFNINVG